MEAQTLVLSGPANTGKSTNIKLTSNALEAFRGIKCLHISTGDFFRDILSDKKHGLYKKHNEEIANAFNEGSLISDETTINVLQYFFPGLGDKLKNSGVIFLDGVVRNDDQYSLVYNELKKLGLRFAGGINLDAPVDVCIKRGLNRAKQAEAEGKTPRFDDKESIIRDRYASFENTQNVLGKYFEPVGLYHEVDASGDLTTVNNLFNRELQKIISVAEKLSKKR